MTDEHASDSVHTTPPIADLTDRAAPTPGPLTKPVAIPRTRPRNRPLWKFLAIGVLVIVIVGAAAALFLPPLFS